MQWQGEAPGALKNLERVSYRMVCAVPVYCLYPRKTRKRPSLTRGAVSSSAVLQLLGGWWSRAAQEPLGCLISSSWARGANVALGCLYWLHWASLGKKPTTQCPEFKPQDCWESMALVRTLAWHVPSARNKQLWAGYKQVTSRLQASYKQIASRLQAGYKHVTEVPYGLTARGANLLQRSESVCFPGLTAEQNLYESSIWYRPAFKQTLNLCQKEHLLIFTSLGCLENVLGQKVLANMCEQQRVCQSSAQLLKPSTSPFQKERLLPASFFQWLLEELAPPGGMGWWWPLQLGTLGSALEPGTDRVHEVPPSLVPTPHPKKQSNIYFIMSNRNYINHVKQRLFSGTELVFNSAVNKDFQLWGKNL